MKLLITGAHGQLGRGIIDASQSKGCRVQAPSEEDLDITDLGKVDHIVTDLQPDLVINTAAYTQVDKAETEEALAFKINKTGCSNLARICAQNQIPLIHINGLCIRRPKRHTLSRNRSDITPGGLWPEQGRG